MAEDIRAHARHIQISPQKVRLVINMVRGKDVLEALNTLKFVTNQAARPVSKVIASAVANAEENFGVSRDDLYIHSIFGKEITYCVGMDCPCKKFTPKQKGQENEK